MTAFGCLNTVVQTLGMLLVFQVDLKNMLVFSLCHYVKVASLC